jgi:capsular polysaccharide transport system permease protein
MSQSSNEDRIRQWRSRQGNASSTPPEGDADAGGVPSRRQEELDAAEALRIEMADSRIPGDAEVSGAVAEAQLRKWWARINLRRRGLRIIGIPLLCVLFYGLLIAPAGKAVDSSFVILRAGESRDASQVAGLIGAGSGEGLADAYRIREYLRSREAMLAMEQRHGFLAHFREGTWDPFSRPINLPALGLDPHRFYKRRIDIGIDVREGIVRLRVEGYFRRAQRRPDRLARGRRSAGRGGHA